jgi:hypothetical protein
MIDAIEQAAGATILLLALADVFLTVVNARASIGTSSYRNAHLNRCGNISNGNKQTLW